MYKWFTNYGNACSANNPTQQLYDRICPLAFHRICAYLVVFVPFFSPQLLLACCTPVSTAIWESRTSSRGSGPASWGASQCSSASTMPVLYPFTQSSCWRLTFSLMSLISWGKMSFNCWFGQELKQQDVLLNSPFTLKKWWNLAVTGHPNIWLRTRPNSMLASQCLTLPLTARNTETKHRQQCAALSNAGSLVLGPVVDLRPV